MYMYVHVHADFTGIYMYMYILCILSTLPHCSQSVAKCDEACYVKYAEVHVYTSTAGYAEERTIPILGKRSTHCY